MNKQMMLILAGILAIPLVSSAAIYKHVDQNGHVTYSNVKIKGAKKLDLEPNGTSFGTIEQRKYNPTNPESSPATFPNVDKNTQEERDNSRKRILVSELTSERLALAEAKKAYDEGAANPEVFKTANGSTHRNVAKYQEKMKRLQTDIDVHQRNIELLEREISNIN